MYVLWIELGSSICACIFRFQILALLSVCIKIQTDRQSFVRAGESTDSSVRYAAYAARVRTILLAAQRYVAYTSDIGESFRPIAHPNLVRGAYAVSWAYIGGDVFYEGYKAYLRQKQAMETRTDESLPPIAALPRKIPAIDDYKAVAVKRAVFQSIASMGLPAFTIHTIVRYSGRAMKNVKSPKLRTWGPIGVSISSWRVAPFHEHDC